MDNTTSTLDNNNDNDDYIYTNTTTDLEEGIEVLPIILVLDVGISSPLSNDDNNNDNANATTTAKKIKSKNKRLLLLICCSLIIVILATITATTTILLLSKQHSAPPSPLLQQIGNGDSNAGDSNSNVEGDSGGDKELLLSSSSYETPLPPRDLFLLSGQSNMIGHTTSGSSIEGNGNYWDKLKSILDAAAANEINLATMERTLYRVIYKTNYENDEVATSLTNGIMNLLYNNSSSSSSSSTTTTTTTMLLTNLDTPLTFGKCSFKEVRNEDRPNNNYDDVSQGMVPISSNSNCGHSFGHELLFGRTLELLGGGGAMMKNFTTTSRTRDFEMVKVARGGSGLYEHWAPNTGQHWNFLKETIVERRGVGDWKGFIWHQGSQAAWSATQYGEDRSLSYLGNLTGLVEEVRELMYQNSNNLTTWQCKEEIPVVIVQVGFWPENNAAAIRTRDAQAKFCNDDPRAVLVTTDDLARYYHYDAASFLISGNRIANAYVEALGGVVTCPDRVPSSLPSSSMPSMEPSIMSLVPTVMRMMETDLPSSVTSELV